MRIVPLKKHGAERFFAAHVVVRPDAAPDDGDVYARAGRARSGDTEVGAELVSKDEAVVVVADGVKPLYDLVAGGVNGF